MKTVAMLLLAVIFTSASALSNFGDYDNDDGILADEYTGCFKKEDTICKRRHPDNCTMEVIAKQCPRMCGLCLPFTPKCPDEYPFGCCWNGDEATDLKKSNCPECKDMSPKICARDAIKKDCDYASNTKMTRQMCPVSCNACRDYGFVPCEDSDPRCEKMVDTVCCEMSEILRDVCKKTCGVCS